MNQRNGQPPHDESAEMCLLACHQCDDSLFDKIPLRCDQFYQQNHQTIFRVMLDLHDKGVPTDTVTVASALNDRNLLDDVGGVAYLEECLNITPHTVHAEHYANIVKEKARLRKLHSHCVAIAKASLSGGVTWNELNDGILDLQDLLDDCDSTDLKAVPIGEFIEAHPELNPPVIDGLIRQGETANIIASPKVGKSWLSYDLALSIATGRDWLNTFQTSPGKVLLLDNELHASSIAKRIPTVADALSISLEEYRDRIDVISLRGRLTDFYGIGPFIRRIKKGEYAVLICDSYYRMLPSGISENDNAQIASVFNLLDSYAEMAGLAIFLIHHSTKGSQAEKRTTDVGSGAGALSRAVDSHLILREHEEAGFVVLDAAVRSFPPVEPVVLQWTFPIWQPVYDADPSRLKGKLTKGEQRQSEKDREAILTIAGALLKGPATASVIRQETGFGRDRATRLLGIMKSGGQIACSEIVAAGNKTVEYRLCD